MFDSNWFKLKWLKCRRRWWWSLFASVRALRTLARPIWRFCLLLMVDVRYGIHVWKVVYLHQETWKWNQCLAPVTRIVCCRSRTCSHIPSFGKSCVDYLQQSCINLEKCNDVLFSVAVRSQKHPFSDVSAPLLIIVFIWSEVMSDDFCRNLCHVEWCVSLLRRPWAGDVALGAAGCTVGMEHPEFSHMEAEDLMNYEMLQSRQIQSDLLIP